MIIENGILQGVPFIESPNQGGKINPRFITMHYTAGWTAASAISTLTNPSEKVSAHFVVDRDGTITQLVSCNRKAWHAGPSNFMGFKDLNTHAIGIEYINPGFIYADGKGGYLASDKKSAVPASRLQGYTGMVEMRHPRLGGTPATWLPYTEAQLEAGRRLTKAICDAYDILGVCSHEEIDARGWKTDPGPLFPLAEFKALADKFEGRSGGSPKAPVVARAIVMAESLNCRETPGGTIVGSLLKRGDYVVVQEDRGDWALVYGGKMSRPLWVADRFLDYA